MIKKTTIAVFKEEGVERKEELTGGIPLSVGEEMSVTNNNKTITWRVVDKKVEYINKGENQLVQVTYIFERD